uniref:Phosphoglycerate mutase n=1 Tax=Ditylum brightwellii TaxID=49249 RepID=A0A6U3RFF1_9STRA|mmetsp:Transcript_10373/g.15323  ORF Transcript_10373/g.15323 Transcript_10373/m.15323 type:complete len:577 (+) Transcript_10373:71-1801(+)
MSCHTLPSRTAVFSAASARRCSHSMDLASKTITKMTKIRCSSSLSSTQSIATGTSKGVTSQWSSESQINCSLTTTRSYCATRIRKFGDNNNDGSKATKPKKEPVPINKTPRGMAAARIKKPESSPSFFKVPPPPPEDITGDPQHCPSHFIKGGTPCDPAPPPFRLALYGEESVHTLVLLRHGESEWNSQNRYTGWCDVNLTKRGEMEARAAGRLLNENGIELDHAFTSVLKRASFTTNMALNMAKQHWVPVTKTWRLNERHYGALQGYNKDTAYAELGIDQELVMEMRRSYHTRPPMMRDDHQFWHGNDRRYKGLSNEQLDRSRGESLKDTAERIMPFFNSVIIPSLRSGNKCIVVSHANTIRTLIKQIDNISDEDIKQMSIPTGIPLLYRLDKDLRPVDPKFELEFQYMVEPKGFTWATSHGMGFHGVYLGDLERLQDIQRKRDATNRDWQSIILKNIAKAISKESAGEGKESDGVIETRQLWWQIHTKMQTREFGNMALLSRMKEHLEKLMFQRKQRHLTMPGFESILKKVHLDMEGKVVEPFVSLLCDEDRENRQKRFYDSLVDDLEGECLIK